MTGVKQREYSLAFSSFQLIKKLFDVWIYFTLYRIRIGDIITLMNNLDIIFFLSVRMSIEIFLRRSFFSPIIRYFISHCYTSNCIFISHMLFTWVISQRERERGGEAVSEWNKKKNIMF